MSALESQLTALIQAEIPSLVQIRHELHENPGVNFQETYASALVQRELGQAGVAYRSGLGGGTGVVAHLPGAEAQAIGLRADIDALPIEEQNDFAYISKSPGVMHACGHDGHTTILIGVARVLAKIAKQRPLPRPVTFIFQPAEEVGAGADRMIADGCLDGSLFAPPVRHMFALHGWPTLPQGYIATRVGPMMAATYSFRVKITGKGCHAAFPHLGRDPLVAAAAIITAAQTIVARNVDPLSAAVVSITQCHGGSAFNIIPGEVLLDGTIRALDKAVEALVVRRFEEIVRHIAAAHECTAEIEYPAPPYPVTVNAEEAIAILKSVVPQTDTTMLPVMGGEDFAFYGHRVPACFFFLGLQPGPEKIPGLHHPKFDFNDAVIEKGIETFCRLALRAE